MITDFEKPMSKEKTKLIEEIRGKNEELKESRRAYMYNPTEGNTEKYEALKLELKALLSKLR